jgi:hypothetical protein
LVEINICLAKNSRSALHTVAFQSIKQWAATDPACFAIDQEKKE